MYVCIMSRRDEEILVAQNPNRLFSHFFFLYDFDFRVFVFVDQKTSEKDMAICVPKILNKSLEKIFFHFPVDLISPPSSPDSSWLPCLAPCANTSLFFFLFFSLIFPFFFLFSFFPLSSNQPDAPVSSFLSL